MHIILQRSKLDGVTVSVQPEEGVSKLSTEKGKAVKRKSKVALAASTIEVTTMDTEDDDTFL